MTLDYHGASAYPGSAEPAHQIGPLILAPVDERERTTISVAPREYRRLCEGRYDWIEGFAPE